MGPSAQNPWQPVLMTCTSCARPFLKISFSRAVAVAKDFPDTHPVPAQTNTFVRNAMIQYLLAGSFTAACKSVIGYNLAPKNMVIEHFHHYCRFQIYIL